MFRSVENVVMMVGEGGLKWRPVWEERLTHTCGTCSRLDSRKRRYRERYTLKSEGLAGVVPHFP